MESGKCKMRVERKRIKRKREEEGTKGIFFTQEAYYAFLL